MEYGFQQFADIAEISGEDIRTAEYLAERMSFLRPNDRVLLCFAKRESDSIGGLFDRAVRLRGAVPVWWKEDLLWKTLLWQAFHSRATVVIGYPLVILGLTKLARYKRTPLYIRHVVTAGYPCQDWMIEGIVAGLDCATWGCFDPKGVVAGFSCGRSLGVHLRTDAYQIELLDDAGKPAEEGENGRVILHPVQAPALSVVTGSKAKLVTEPCPCGCGAPRLMDIRFDAQTDPDLDGLAAKLHYWSSILDCRIHRGSYGLELEIVTFPGEKLPVLPSSAKQVIRSWDPEKDIPFGLIPSWENPDFSRENH